MDGFLRQCDGGEEFLQEGRNGRSVPCAVHLAEIFTIPGKDYKRAGGSKSKVYSITKYGEETAIRLATELSLGFSRSCLRYCKT
jgi:hypothetical protein